MSEETISGENPYTTPEASTLEDESASMGSEEEALRAYVGKNPNYYLSKWFAVLEGHGRDTGFNWAAFFLSGFWLPYRKMYLISVVFYSAIFLESVIEMIVFLGIMGREQAPVGVEVIAPLLAAIVCGWFGNRWYLNHARKKIADVRAAEGDEAAILERLSKLGGTSLGAALGFFLAALVTVAAVAVVAGFVFVILSGQA